MKGVLKQFSLSFAAALVALVVIAGGVYAVGGWSSDGGSNLIAEVGSPPSKMVKITTTGVRIGDATSPTEKLEVNGRIKLGVVAHAALPTVAEGTIVVCTDCKSTATSSVCAASGNGALALRVGSAWICASGIGS